MMLFLVFIAVTIISLLYLILSDPKTLRQTLILKRLELQKAVVAVLQRSSRHGGQTVSGSLTSHWVSLVWQHVFVPFSITPNVDYYSALFGRVVVAHYIFGHSNKECIQEPPLHPIGFAKWIDLAQFCSHSAIELQKPLLTICLLLYASNKFPIFSLTYILAYLTVVYQAVNSNGTIFHGYQVVALTLLMQWGGQIFLYFRNRVLKLKPSDEPEGHYGNVTEDAFIFRLSALGVCGIYVTSAISKHAMSKGQWFDHAEYFITNFVSVNEREYYNQGIQSSDFTAVILPQIMARYPVLARWFFGSAFYLELIAPLFLYNRFTMLVGGAVTWLFHEGIALSMRLTFVSHQRILLAYFIDPVYWIQVSAQLSRFYHLFQSYRNNGELVLPASPSQHNENSGKEKDKEVRNHGFANNTTNNNGNGKNSETLTELLGLSSRSRSGSNDYTQNNSNGNGSRIRRLLAYLWRFPFKSMILLILLGLYFQEVFPFSNFPMYGVPPQRGDYFYITDKDNQPLFTRVNFMMSGAQMKRSFFTSCKKYYSAVNKQRPTQFRFNSTALEHCGNQSLAFFNKIVWPHKRQELEWRKPWSLNWVYIELQKKDLTVTKQTTVIARLDRNETYLAMNPNPIPVPKNPKPKKKATTNKAKTKTDQPQN